jgi:uncharacterized protein YbjT (DUF2867 family)
MKVVLFGASGMIGQGVLRECLLDPDVEAVLSIGRSPTGQDHPKLRESIRTDLSDYSAIESELRGFDACFFCLGISSAGMDKAAYTKVTYDFTLSAANALLRQNPEMTFIYVSGAGTDGSERGRVMWARVKGRTENALLALPFRRAYMFRPAYIQPMYGATSKTKSYRILYKIVAPFYPVLRRLFPHHVTTTEQVGRAMLRAAKEGAPKRVLESDDIKALAESAR